MKIDITRTILNWSEEKFEDVCNGTDKNLPNLKAFGLGALEGFIDGVVVLTPVVIVGSIIHKCIKK